MFFRLLFLFLFIQIHFANASATELIPLEDSVAQLFDDDQISLWSQARNYQGEITRTPHSDGVGNDVGRMGVRSDDAVGPYRIYRASLVFDLSDIDVDNIKKVSMKLTGVNSDPIHDTDIVITSHERVDVDYMSKEDWKIQHYGTEEFSRGKLSPSNVETEFVFGESGVNYIKNSQEKVVIGIMTSYDFDDIEPSVYTAAATWYSSESPVNKPYLEITYTVPGDDEDGEEDDEFPLYTQIVSPYPSEEETGGWAFDKFARGADEEALGLCPYVKSCGCMITSLVMLARHYGIAEGVDGSDVNPGNFNQWLIGNDGYDAKGNLRTAQAIKYFGVEEGGVIKSFFDFDEDVLDSGAVKALVGEGRPVVSEVVAYNNDGTVVPQHFILVTELLSGEYQVNDPLWYNTSTLDDVKTLGWQQDYNNLLTSGRDLTFIDEPTSVSSKLSLSLLGQEDVEGSASSVYVANSLTGEYGTAPADFYMVTPAGDRLGFDVRSGNVFDIEDGSYQETSFLQDPFAESFVDGVTKQIDASLGETGTYEVYVVGVGEGVYELSGLLLDSEGGTHSFSFVKETVSGMIDVYLFNPETGEFLLKPVDGDLLDTLIDQEISDEINDRFFKMWADKIFAEIDGGKLAQAKKHVETFRTLLVAKKVESEALWMVLDRLVEEVD